MRDARGSCVERRPRGVEQQHPFGLGRMEICADALTVDRIRGRIRRFAAVATTSSGDVKTGGLMSRTSIVAVTGIAVLCLAAVVAAAGTATAAGGPPSIAAGPAFGFIPSRNAGHGGSHGGGGGHVVNLTWHNGPVMHSTTVNPVFWGTAWGNSSFMDNKQSGLDTLYSGIGGTPYARSNGEYYDA